MIRLMFSLVLPSVIAVTSTTAMARSRHQDPPATQWLPHNDFNAVFVAGTYAGSDPDPNVRAALRREYDKQGE
jgi:hypothetical protein